MDFKRLFSPAKVGRLEIKNRFVVPPMGTGLANEDGTVTQPLTDYWVARAKGGWGLLIMEFTAVDPLGKWIPCALGLWDDRHIPGLRKLTDALHKYGDGAKIAIQISHAGRQTSSQVIGAQPVSASSIPCTLVGEVPRELSREEIDQVIERYGDAARRACEAGFDIVMLHGAHGYLVAEFMSGYFNKRMDEFGGSFENRMRFSLEIIRNIKSKTANSVPLAFRFSSEERVPGGRTIEESRMVARIVEEAGIDLIDVSVGCAESDRYILAPAAVPAGFLLPLTAEIRKVVSVPVIAVGRINHPWIAEQAIEEGKADFVAFGRASLADPDLPKKVASGRIDEIRHCISCLQGCTRVFGPPGPSGKATIACLVNPLCAREGQLRMESASKKKRVVVVGGGPGGLEAAWRAACRGHEVILYERHSVFGGQLRVAAMPPFKQAFSGLVNHSVQMAKRFGARLNLGVEATPELILGDNPDVVVLGTGGEPAVPESIKGVDLAANAAQIIAGDIKAGHKVVIAGGGSTGCETADFLGEHMHEVTIVEALPEIAADVPFPVRAFLMDRLKGYGVGTETGFAITEFLADGVIGQKNGQTVRLMGFDTVIAAMGTRSVNPLEEKLKGSVPELYVIGDAASPRKAIDAIEEGARIGTSI
jgi:2,4-dienoyl-CoA reductase-like NADH-dependent reductase (Old Yellow Enzyme family)/thioredoxin reductase